MRFVKHTLNNVAANIRFVGDLQDASLINGGATGERKAQQEFYIGYGQDEWRVYSDGTGGLLTYCPGRARREFARNAPASGLVPLVFRRGSD